MDRTTIEERVIDILIEGFDIERAAIKPQTDIFKEYDLSSIDKAMLLSEFDDSFNLDIPENTPMRTVSEMVNYINYHMNTKKTY